MKKCFFIILIISFLFIILTFLSSNNDDGNNIIINYMAQSIRQMPSGSIRDLSLEIETSLLPEVYDLNALGYTTSIKNQGVCGSCWAHSAVACFEASINKKYDTQIEYDFSEQYLISCNLFGYNCLGGMVPFDFMKEGLPEESCYPYKEADSACDISPSCEKKYGVDFWYYCSDSTTSTIESIKAALYLYGPVWTFIAYDSALIMHKTGVYDKTTSNYTNHTVTIVGWDDTKGNNGAWRVRNSYGTDWAESGYAWIGYGINTLGVRAAYMILNDVVPASN